MHAAPALHRGPWDIESTRINDCHRRLQCFALFNRLEPLDNVQPIRVGRAIIIHKGFVVESDRIDDKFITLVMAYRLAVLGGRHMRRMPPIQIDAAHLMIELPDDPDFFGRLDEMHRLEPAQ